MTALRAILLLLLLFPAGGYSLVRRHDIPDDKYIQKAKQLNCAKSVGMIEARNQSGSLAGRFGGSLIASNLILTAAHVAQFCKNKKATIHFGAGLSKFTKHAKITRWIYHPFWAGSIKNSPGYDLAIGVMDQKVNHLDPISIYKRDYGFAINNAGEFGQEAIMIGFGQTGTGIQGGILFDHKKRAGTTLIEKTTNPKASILITHFCKPDRLNPHQKGKNRTATELEFGLGMSDSGSPLIIKQNGTEKIVGVASGSSPSPYGKINYKYGSQNIYSAVASRQSFHWIWRTLHGTQFHP